MTFPTYEKWGEKVAEQAIDVYLINGRTIREWIEILSDELTMLDKIRAEIEAIDTVKVKLDDYMNIIKSPDRVKDEVLEIIDKYRNEVSE